MSRPVAPPQTPTSALLTTNHLYLLGLNHDALSRKLPAVTRCPTYEQLADVTKYRLFCLDSLFSLSVSPLQNFLTSPTPFGTLVAAPWLCSPGAWWSFRAGLPSGIFVRAGGGLFSRSSDRPEHPCCMGSGGFAPRVSGGSNEGSACAPFLLQPTLSYRQELLGRIFCYILTLLPAAETSWDMVYGLGDNSRASPEPSCWQISWLWETSQPFSVFWGAPVCP